MIVLLLKQGLPCISTADYNCLHCALYGGVECASAGMIKNPDTHQCMRIFRHFTGTSRTCEVRAESVDDFWARTNSEYALETQLKRARERWRVRTWLC